MPYRIQILLLAALNILRKKTQLAPIKYPNSSKNGIFPLHLVLCVQGSSEKSGFYTTLQAEQNTVLNDMAVHPTWKKRKLKCREDSFFSLFFPLPLARNNENGNIESRILRGCASFTMIPVYTLPAARQRLIQTRQYSKALCPKYPLLS